MRRATSRLLAALLFAAALPVQAGLFDDEEARARIEKLRLDFDELGKRVEIASRNQIDFANQAETLKSEVARLRGQLEVIVYDLETAQKRQKDFYVDLDNRLRKLEAGAVEAKPEGKPEGSVAKSADPAAETRDYEAALTAFKGAKYKDAQAGFLGFIKSYPNSTMIASAHFWAASSHYQLKDFAKAAELFGTLAANWPNDARAPDALLAQANAQAEAGDAKGSRKTLELLVDKYPTSNAALTAKPRLKTAAPAKKK
jgi:tol-pal system protein YbgF